MQGDRDISCSLISAVREGRLDRVRELISSFSLSDSLSSSDGYVLLRDALKNKHREVAKLLLTNGSKVNSKTENPCETPLHFAVRNGDPEIVEMLLDRRAKIDAESEYGTTPLHDAIRWKKMGIFQRLLSRGANINAVGKYGITALHIAAEAGYLPIVEHLLSHRANVNSVCTCGSNECCTPLYIAVINGHEKVVKILLVFGANVNAQDQDDKTALHYAVEKGHSVIIQHILQHCPDLNNISNRCALKVAMHGGGKQYSKIVENLVEYGFPANLKCGNNSELLHGAVAKGYLKIVEELLKYGVSINSKDGYGSTALHVASEWNTPESVLIHLQYYADIDPKAGGGTLALDFAYDRNNRKIVELLLKFGADIDSKNQRGKTALQIASGKGKLEIVEILLKFGADIDSRDEDGNTALHIASAKHKLEIVEALLKFGVDIDSKDQCGRTVLHNASERSNKNHVEVLLKFGASIDSKDQDGKTALHIASRKGNIQIVDVLLKYGADTNSKDRHGKTALYYVSQNRSWIFSSCRIEMVKMMVVALLDHGSDITIMGEWNYSRSLAEIFKRHAVRVKTANLDVKNRNLLTSSNDEELSDFRNKCEKEVASMKSEKFGNSNISFYDILTKGISQLATYAGNESIVQVFGSDYCKLKFPTYATMINNNFRKGERRKVLMERFNEMFHFRFTNFLGIPYVCTEKIFNYLSNADLTTVMNACRPISVSSPNTDNK